MNKVSIDLSKPSPYVESDSRAYRFKRRLTYGFAFHLIRKHFGSAGPKSVLEVGTGSGFFLDFFAERYPAAAASGVEYDERLLEVTKARAPRANCIQGNAENFDLSPQSFDLVVSFQVIEHLFEPEKLVQRARCHLNPGGLLILTTPNLAGLGARVMKDRWHGYRDDHVSLKAADQWTSLVAAQGFRPVYSGSTFFSGIPWMNRLPLGLLNWGLLTTFGAWPWRHGESYVGAFVPV